MFPLRLFDLPGTYQVYFRMPYFMTKYRLLSPSSSANNNCSFSSFCKMFLPCFFYWYGSRAPAPLANVSQYPLCLKPVAKRLIWLRMEVDSCSSSQQLPFTWLSIFLMSVFRRKVSVSGTNFSFLLYKRMCIFVEGLE